MYQIMNVTLNLFLGKRKMIKVILKLEEEKDITRLFKNLNFNQSEEKLLYFFGRWLEDREDEMRIKYFEGKRGKLNIVLRG